MFLFNKKKKYVSCNLIEHGIDFDAESINLCCRMVPEKHIKLIDNYSGEPINWNKYFSIKNKYRKLMQKGKIIPECKNCIYLEEKEWDNDNYISYINFNNWITCNKHCLYCNLNDWVRNKNKQYNIFPIINDLEVKGYLRKGGHITIAGGEPCSAPEFNDLINLFIKNDMSNIRILTNATIYSRKVEQGIKEGRINIVVSVDSGTKETFIKIKRRDFYDKVWENLKKYASIQPEPNRVKAKYIIIPQINDNKEEIDAWINKSIEAGIKHLTLDLEMMYYDANKDKIPEYLYDLFEYAIKQIKSKGLALELIDRGFIISKKLEQLNRI